MNSSSWPITSSRQALRVEGLQLFELLAREIEPLPLDVLVVRHPADRRFLADAAAVGAVDDPLEHAHVFAEARPDELAVRRPCGTS